MILTLILCFKNTYLDQKDAVNMTEQTVKAGMTDKNAYDRKLRDDIPPTRTPNIVYYYYTETESMPFLITAIVILSLVIVVSFVFVIIACLKRERGEIYADDVGPLSKPNDTGTVIIKSVYFTHVVTNEQQPDEP